MIRHIIAACSLATCLHAADDQAKTLAALRPEVEPLPLEASYVPGATVVMPAGIQVLADRDVTFLVPAGDRQFLVISHANSGQQTVTCRIVGMTEAMNPRSITAADGYLCQAGRIPIVNGVLVLNLDKALDPSVSRSSALLVPRVQVEAGVAMTAYLRNN
jgi:hypothetical protein